MTPQRPPTSTDTSTRPPRRDEAPPTPLDWASHTPQPPVAPLPRVRWGWAVWWGLVLGVGYFGPGLWLRLNEQWQKMERARRPPVVAQPQPPVIQRHNGVWEVVSSDAWQGRRVERLALHVHSTELDLPFREAILRNRDGASDTPQAPEQGRPQAPSSTIDWFQTRTWAYTQAQGFPRLRVHWPSVDVPPFQEEMDKGWCHLPTHVPAGAEATPFNPLWACPSTTLTLGLTVDQARHAQLRAATPPRSQAPDPHMLVQWARFVTDTDAQGQARFLGWDCDWRPAMVGRPSDQPAGVLLSLPQPGQPGCASTSRWSRWWPDGVSQRTHHGVLLFCRNHRQAICDAQFAWADRVVTLKVNSGLLPLPGTTPPADPAEQRTPLENSRHGTRLQFEPAVQLRPQWIQAAWSFLNRAERDAHTPQPADVAIDTQLRHAQQEVQWCQGHATHLEHSLPLPPTHAPSTHAPHANPTASPKAHWERAWQARGWETVYARSEQGGPCHRALMRVVDLLGLWDSPWWNTPGHTSQAPVDRPTGLSLAQAQQGLAVLQNIATLRASVRGQPDEGVEMLLDEATRRVEGDGSTAFLERLMSSRHTSLNTPRLQRIQRIHDAPHSPLHTLPAFKRLQVRDLIAHGLYGFTTRPTTADEQAKAVRLWQLAAQDALDMAQAPPSSSSSTPHLRQERINALVMAALDSHLARDWPALERWVHGLEQFAQEVIRTPDVPEPGHWAGHAVMHASYHRRNLALAMHPAPQQQQRLEALIAWASTVPELTQSPLPWLAGAKFHLNEVRQGRAVPDACIAGGLMSCRIWVGSP